MPAVIPAAIGAVVVAGAAAAYYKFRRPAFARVGMIEPGLPPLTQAQKFITASPGGLVPLTEAQKFVTSTKGPAAEKFPGGSAGPPVNVSVAGGWAPIFFSVAQSYTLEWGACFFQWSKDLQKHGMSDHKAKEWIAGALGTVMTWIVTISGLGFIVNRVCFRVWMPALKLHISGALGSMELIGPAEPRGLRRVLSDGTVVPGTGKNNAGGVTIEGWNPSSSRVGFSAKFGKWPREWPPPAGQKGAGWVRDLGDLAGVGYPVYQVITAQNGEEKSWPMMTKAGWRAMFRLGGDHTLVAVVKNGQVSNRASMDLFDAWKPTGHKGLQKSTAGKVKATNRYK